MAEIKTKILTDEIKMDELIEDPSDPFGIGGETNTVTNVTNITNTIGSLPSYVASTVTANPGGADQQVQFNDGGTTFGTDTDFTWNKTTNTLNIGTSGGFINSGGELQLTTTNATGSDIVLQGGTGTTSNGVGGDIQLIAGDGGTTNGNGGDVIMSGGDKAGTGAGGDIRMAAADGGATTNGGAFQIIVGEGSTGISSSFQLGSTANQAFSTRYFPTASTTDATVTTLFTHSPSSSSLNYYELRVRAIRTGGTAGSAQDSAAYVVRAAYKRVGAAAPTIVGAITADYTAEDQAGWDCTFAVSGNTVLAQVTGAIDNNVSWRGELKIFK